MYVPAALVWIRIVVVAAFMFAAALEDIRKREVRDCWWGAIAACHFLYLVQMYFEDRVCWEIPVSGAAALLSFAAAAWAEGRTALTLAAGVIASCLTVILLGNADGAVLNSLLIPVFVSVYCAMYRLGVLRGGADCKCLMALSVAFPVYPEVGRFPILGTDGTLSVVFAFSISVLFVGAVATTAFHVANVLVRNRGLGRGISGYIMPIDRAERSFVWPLEDVVDGETRRVPVPDDETVPDIYRRLRESGRTEVLVTPMMPFIAVLAAAFVFVITVGSPLVI